MTSQPDTDPQDETPTPVQTIICTYGEATDDLESCQDGSDDIEIEGYELLHGERIWLVGSPDHVAPDGTPMQGKPVCSFHLPWLLASLHDEGEGPQLVVPIDSLDLKEIHP